jgi:hypothetical protein
MNTFKRNKSCLALLLSFFLAMPAYSDSIVNNYSSGGAPQAATSPCPPANQNNIYDPRVPPAGTYKVQNGDGSSQTIYTTGEKKPYITDNNCNNNSVGPISPYVNAPYPPRPHHR